MPPTRAELERKLRRKHPDLVPYLQVPELKRILLRGIKKNWNFTKFRSAIEGSKWYRTHNEHERRWITYTPADKQRQTLEVGEEMAAWYNDLLDTKRKPKFFGDLARKVASGRMTMDTFQRKVRNSKEYRQRYVGNFARQRAGLPMLDEDEYRSREESYRQVLARYGMPSEFADDPKDFAALFRNNTTAEDFGARMEVFYNLTSTYGGRVREAFQRHAGVDLSDGDAFRVITGQRPDLAKTYAEATGTEMFDFRGAVPTYLRQTRVLSPRAVTAAMQAALGEERALFHEGGGTMVEPPRSRGVNF